MGIGASPLISNNNKNLALVKKNGDKTQFTITRFHCIGRIETTKDLMNKYKRINESYGTTVFFLQDNNHPGHHILCIVM